MLRQHIAAHLPLSTLAGLEGISILTAYKSLARYHSRYTTALVDRRSVRHTQRLTLDPRQLQRTVDLRDECCILRRVAKVLAAPLSFMGRILKELGLGRNINLEPT